MVAQVEVPAVRVATQGAVMASDEGAAGAVQAAVQGAVMAAVEVCTVLGGGGLKF